MLAIVLLSGLGVWAVQSANLAEGAAGFRRESRQVQYVSELGFQSGMAYLSVPGVSTTLYAMALRAPDDCASAGATSFCKSITLEEIEDLTTNAVADPTNPGTGAFVLDTNAAGSLSHYKSAAATDAGVQGNFYLELTDPETAQVPGVDLSKTKYKRVTMTSFGLVRPPAATACNATANAAAGRLATRAHVLIGPVD